MNKTILGSVKKLGADYVATGHYARNEFNQESGRWELKKGINPKKDQTYFLYRFFNIKLKIRKKYKKMNFFILCFVI